MSDDKYLLSSVSNALEILDALGETQAMGVAEISKLLNMGKSSVFRLLYTLESKGYVYKDSTAKYMLSRKFSYLGSIVAERQNEFHLTHPTLVKLRNQTGETVHLGILISNNKVMFVDKIQSDYQLQMNSRIGYELDSYASGCGKALLSVLLDTPREDELKQIKFKKFTDKTITSYEQLIKVLRHIQECGYSLDDEESEQGLTCVSVPIISHQGKAPIAISISGSTSRINAKMEENLRALREAADEISNILAF